jgi:hypothetical protein
MVSSVRKLFAHRWMLALAGLFPGITGCAAAHQFTEQSRNAAYARAPAMVMAQNFVLVDATGKPLVELSAAPDGAGLLVLDQSGKPRAAVIVTKTGEPGIKLYDTHGAVRAAMVVSSDDQAGLALYDPKGNARAALVSKQTGESSLVLLDESGKQVASLPPPSPPAASAQGSPGESATPSHAPKTHPRKRRANQ